MTEIDVESLYKIALAKINDEHRTPIRTKFPNIKGLTPANYLEIQDSILNAYITQDRFRIYHIAKVEGLDIAKIVAESKKTPFRYDFISNPSFSDWSISIDHDSVNNKLQLSFAKFTYRQVRNTDTSEDAEVYLNIPYFFVIKAEVVTHNKSTFLIITLPSFRPTPFGTYEYTSEIDYVFSWLSNFGSKNIPLDYKEVFEKLDSKIFDKFGYKGEDIKAEGSGIINAVFHLKLTNKEIKSKELHDTINTLVGPKFAEIVFSQLEDIWDDEALNISDRVRDRMFSSLLGMKISEKYTTLLHSACEYGIGYVKLPTQTINQEYNIEYTKSGNGLIRSKCEKWVAFKPLYEAIIANHSES